MKVAAAGERIQQTRRGLKALVVADAVVSRDAWQPRVIEAEDTFWRLILQVAPHREWDYRKGFSDAFKHLTTAEWADEQDCVDDGPILTL